MPLIPPALDDRSYGDLVQDMLASIPAHTPEWTVQQPGDPGRTLIELFAWLADSILYRANLIPERQRLAFLKLLGLPLQPAAAATGILSVFSDPAKTTAITLAQGAKIPGPVTFETLSELDVLPVTGQVYVKVPLSNSQTTTSMPLLQGLQQLYNLSAVPAGYTTTPVFANNLADPNGVDVFGATTDQCIWFALRRGETAEPGRCPRHPRRQKRAAHPQSWIPARATRRKPACRYRPAHGRSRDMADQRKHTGGATHDLPLSECRERHHGRADPGGRGAAPVAAGARISARRPMTCARIRRPVSAPSRPASTIPISTRFWSPGSA